MGDRIAVNAVAVGSGPAQATIETGHSRVAHIVGSLVRTDGEIGCMSDLYERKGQLGVTMLWNSLASASVSVAQSVIAQDRESTWAVTEMTVQTLMLLSGWLQEQGMLVPVWDDKSIAPGEAKAVLGLRDLGGKTKVCLAWCPVENLCHQCAPMGLSLYSMLMQVTISGRVRQILEPATISTGEHPEHESQEGDGKQAAKQGVHLAVVAYLSLLVSARAGSIAACGVSFTGDTVVQSGLWHLRRSSCGLSPTS